MGSFDNVSSTPPAPAIRPTRTQPLPQRKRREDTHGRPSSRKQPRPAREDKDPGTPHIDEYA